MRVSEKGIKLIKEFEGLRLKAYKAIPEEKYYTIGYGHYGADVKPNMVITEADAEKYLQTDLNKCKIAVNKLRRKFNQNQFDALCSFAYNCGIGNLNTLCKPERSLPQIADAMLLYNKASGKVLKGLQRRREAERKLFLS